MKTTLVGYEMYRLHKVIDHYVVERKAFQDAQKEHEERKITLENANKRIDAL